MVSCYSSDTLPLVWRGYFSSNAAILINLGFQDSKTNLLSGPEIIHLGCDLSSAVGLHKIQKFIFMGIRIFKETFILEEIIFVNGNRLPYNRIVYKEDRYCTQPCTSA
jgi:hypothetical protein